MTKPWPARLANLLLLLALSALAVAGLAGLLALMSEVLGAGSWVGAMTDLDHFCGPVVSVHDGDTLTVRGAVAAIRVRLWGIDAPELAQPYGEASRDALRALAPVGVEVCVEVRATDQYGRTVGLVSRPSKDLGSWLLNIRQLEAGLAWHYAAYTKDTAERPLLSAAHTAARKARRGLWQDPHPVPPWTWRHAHASEGVTP